MPQIQVIASYVQTNGYQLSADSSTGAGRAVAVGIHFRVSSGDRPPVQALTTFELGASRSGGFDLHPDGLITREEVFPITNPSADAAA